MEKILILNTGGTFNKVYDEIKGQLIIKKNNKAIKKIIDTSIRGNLPLEVKGILYKDSLEINNKNRKEILKNIKAYSKVLIIHGTDTMDKTALYLSKKIKNKVVVITGAMKPFSIEPIEASSNFSMALAFLTQEQKSGIYISMHGLTKKHNLIKKNRELGIFECQK